MEKVLLALWFASMEYGVSYELLYALAKVESGLYPYAVNVEGRSFFGNTWRAVECYHRGEGRAGNYGTYSARVCGVIYGKEMCFTF